MDFMALTQENEQMRAENACLKSPLEERNAQIDVMHRYRMDIHAQVTRMMEE